MNREPVRLDAARRRIVQAAVRETCEIRRWHLYAMNVRTNHAHIVLAGFGNRPEIALNAFKANSTRQMRQAGQWPSEKTPWAEKGSIRRLWNEQSIAAAMDYVINGQGKPLPDFGRF